MNRTSSRPDYPLNPQHTFGYNQVYTNVNEQPQQTVPNYLQDNTTYLHPSTTLQQGSLDRVSVANTTRGSIPITQYQPLRASQSIVYGAAPPAYDYNVRTSAVSQGRRQMRTSYVPVVNYVPIVQEVPQPIIQPQISRVSQRVIVHEPEIYQKRETNYQYPKQTLPPTRTVVQQQVNYDPMVETVRGPSWGGQSVRASRIRSPPPPTVAKPQKSCFPWWGWLLLGLLGLAGLILAIIFGTKHGQTAVESSKVAAVAPSTVPITTNTTTNTSTNTHSRPASVQPSTDLTSATISGSTATTNPIQADPNTVITSTVTPATNVVQPITMEPTTIPSSQVKTVEPISSSSTATYSSSSTVQPNSTGSINSSTSGSSSNNVTTTSTTSGYTTTGSIQPTYSSIQPTSSVQPYSSGSVQPITTEPMTVQPSTVQPIQPPSTTSSSGTSATNTSGTTNSTSSNTSSSTTRTTTTTTTTTTHALVARHHHQ